MTLRIGVLGAASVATYAMIAVARDLEGVTVAAVAARDPARARDYAELHGIPKTYDSYEALISAADVDAIYNALPPSLHVRWSIAAMQAGKPVLCEKPFALSVGDAVEMVAAEAQTGQLLMEAQHSHYHPLSARMRDIVSSGQLGELTRADARFDIVVKPSPNQIRFNPDVGGGALWDLGVYPAHWLCSVLGNEAEVVSAAQTLADTGADIATRAELRFSSGLIASLSCDMAAPFSAHAEFEGTRGKLIVRNPLAPQHGHRLELVLDGITSQEEFSKRASYAYQLEAFRDAVTKSAPVPTRGSASLSSVKLLSAIRDRARQ